MLSSMLDVFLEVVLPVAVTAALGGLAARWRKIPADIPAVLVFYIFSPALVFRSLSVTTVSAEDSFRIVAVLLISFFAMFVFSMIWSTLRGHDVSMRAGFALGASTPNSGNMGLPVSQLAFGELGLQIAVLNFVASAVLTNTAGIAIAAMAGGSARNALLAPLKFPALYAAVAGIAVNVSGIELPVAIDTPMESLGDAAIPTMLVVLGIQLGSLSGHDGPVDLGVATIGRLLIAPAAAWLTVEALGVEGATRGALIVLAAMPTAVSAIVLATTFKARPAFVTQAVVSTTIASMLTLTLLIDLVR